MAKNKSVFPPEEHGAFHTAKEEVKFSKARKKLKKPFLPAFLDEDFLLREELRPVRLQLELLKPELTLQEHGVHETIVFFGSARIPDEKAILKEIKNFKRSLKLQPSNHKIEQALQQAQCIARNSAYLKEAEKLAFIIGNDKKSKFVVLSGGGPSFMKAANKGAKRAKSRSVSLKMMLPMEEQETNKYAPPELTFPFHYFAIRKMHFLMRAKAIAVFPGGFGTMDELFEVLTLIQTQKIARIPLLLFRKEFWQKIINFEGLVDEGVISRSDLDLIQYVETAEQAWELINAFYRVK